MRYLLIHLFVLLFSGSDIYAASLTSTVTDKDGLPVKDAIVYAVPSNDLLPDKKKASGAVIDQIDKEFIPYLTVIEVNTYVNFPNSDNIHHHVYSLSEAKTFELPLYIGMPSAPVLFEKTGDVTLGCNIHDWMVAHIYVLETPYYSKTDKSGFAQLEDIPPAEYKFMVWHPRMRGKAESTEKAITINSTMSPEISFTIDLKPEWHPPRAPLMSGGRYR